MSRAPVWSPRLRPDGFLLAILLAVGIATLLPATGRAAEGMDWVIRVLIAVLFFMYGGRLAPSEARSGLAHWRLHAVILGFTYVVFPLVGLAMAPLEGRLLSAELYAGVLFLCAIPSTVQSSIAFTSIARGNVAGAIVSASLSNLVGIVVTPLLVLLLLATGGQLTLQGGAVIDLVVQLLIPFALGQLSRRWTAEWLAANHGWLKYVDRAVIVLVVYAAFSKGMVEGMWSAVGWSDIGALAAVLAVLLAALLWGTVAAARLLGFDRGDQIAIQFCGTKKSLATGLPMAVVLFPGQPVGLLVLPLMLFHQLQLMACAVVAQRWAREAPPGARMP